MKISFDIDCTPDELRGFFGMPDVKPMQEQLLKEVEDKTGIEGASCMESIVEGLNHLGAKKITIGSRWADQLNAHGACWFLYHDDDYQARMRARFPGRRFRENAACSGSTGGGA